MSANALATTHGAAMHARCAALQAMQAAKELQRNLAADNAGLVYAWKVWCSTVTAHQMVCGDLAAWCALHSPVRDASFACVMLGLSCCQQIISALQLLRLLH